MGKYNQLSRYGAIAKAYPLTTGKIFFLLSSSEAQFADFNNRFPVDEDGVVRVYTSWASALAACTAGQGDIIEVSPGFTTALSAAELLSAETKGVTIYQAGKQLLDGSYFENRATAALPASTQIALFTVTGRIKLVSIIGEVTTAIQNQANNTKLVANPTVGADVDICAVASTANDAVGTNYFITGTFATALQKSASVVGVYQAAPLLIPAGTIDLNCAATNTGSVKWKVIYVPIDPGARVFAA